MASKIAKILTVIFGAVLVAYSIRLFISGAQITNQVTPIVASLLLIATILIGLYFILTVFYPRIVPLNRWWLALLGIVMVIGAHLLLVDTPEQYVFLQDIIKVLGVFLIIVWPMKLLVNQKVADEKFNETVEIIEV